MRAIVAYPGRIQAPISRRARYCLTDGAHAVIHLSPRNAAVAAALANEFPHVSIAASNQEVLDAGDVVMLAVRPQIATEVLEALRFRPDHHVISLIATVSLEALAGLVAPARRITRAVPLPATALGKGATAIFPPDPVAAALFDRTGTAIEVDNPEIFDALCAASATMASYFAFADSIASWLTDRGLPAPDARRYVGAIFEGLAATTADAGDQDFRRSPPGTLPRTGPTSSCGDAAPNKGCSKG